MENRRLYNSNHSIHPSGDLSSTHNNYNTIIGDDSDDGESKLHTTSFTTSTEMFVFKIFRAARMGWDSVESSPAATPNMYVPSEASEEDNIAMKEQQRQRNCSARRIFPGALFLIGAVTVMASCFHLSLSSVFSALPSAELFMTAPSWSNMEGLTRKETIAQREADVQQKLLLDGNMIEIDDDDNNDGSDDEENKHEEFETFPLLTSHKKHYKKKKKKKLRQKKETIKIKAPPGCEGTVIIIRHCEKGVIREHCEYLGYERAAYLATQFGDSEEDRWPSPSYIFSLNPGGRHHKKKSNVREIETIQPIADKFNLTANISYKQNQGKLLAHEVMTLIKSGELCGKTALISWKHSAIPHLTTKLGCGPKEGCPSDYPSSTFDLTVQIKYVYGKLLHSDNKQGKMDQHYRWSIYGSTVNEGFDPLKYSKMAGDYVRGGTDMGGRWMSDVDFIEMKKGNTMVTKKKPSWVSRIEGGT
uniref:Uncharacterized protein n=1 Tax=Helicotheca tamesis TaxID=374047 RepID=A0A7S2HMT5_9STRA|mmetsp:Transcript_19414/g.26646  ORF Transcript_19414/g.26646 Transcript_19414/m.26646 type:complete len:473 (+) Transcript_19414:207-1625(+)|eukprot:CAMPEP_0185728250 /NCGR_PEP_ID=MMETSP1171-20130828/3659_1 /TAXON_ID=374046 /ORGANISM="Helicotheca tamensis, Strain CCMP826" /LENGTH=472 /DNA_ID=CAMNT_0028396933 /DNA_START=207 /DNA_END=1625 /DNA_ORIENTATION=+